MGVITQLRKMDWILEGTVLRYVDPVNCFCKMWLRQLDKCRQRERHEIATGSMSFLDVFFVVLRH
jgi:hypothetical protein